MKLKIGVLAHIKLWIRKMTTCYYYVKDPLENFNLKVVVRESSRLVIRENSTIDDAVFHEDVSISWQEKIDGPADVIRNHSKSSSTSSPRVRWYSELPLCSIMICDQMLSEIRLKKIFDVYLIYCRARERSWRMWCCTPTLIKTNFVQARYLDVTSLKPERNISSKYII